MSNANLLLALAVGRFQMACTLVRFVVLAAHGLVEFVAISRADASGSTVCDLAVLVFVTFELVAAQSVS